MSLRKIDRYISRLTPNVHSLNKILVGRYFREIFGRWPRDPRNPDADYHDFLVDRMTRNDWSEFQLRCVDKETAKGAAIEILPEIKVAETVKVIPMRNVTPEAFRSMLSPYMGQPLVAKPTNGSGSVVFLDGDVIDADKLFSISRNSLFYNFRETQYAKLSPKLMIEKRLEGDGGDLNDFKFFCAGGEVLFVQIDSNRFSGHNRILLSYPDLKPLDVRLGWMPRSETWPAPSQRTQDAAKKLAGGFDFVRIDLYESGGETFFGEFTFTPGAGIEPFSDPTFPMELLARIRASHQALAISRFLPA
jgi:hypothetical protein